LALNRRTYRSTGKMMEKYDVVDVQRRAGGGEYATQDGFGWTNGVALALAGQHRLRSTPGVAFPGRCLHPLVPIYESSPRVCFSMSSHPVASSPWVLTPCPPLPSGEGGTIGGLRSASRRIVSRCSRVTSQFLMRTTR